MARRQARGRARRPLPTLRVGLLLLTLSFGLAAVGVGERLGVFHKAAAGVAAQGIRASAVASFRESPLAVGLAAAGFIVLGIAGVDRLGRGR